MMAEVEQQQEGEEEQPQLNAQEERRLKIQRCLQILVHANRCPEVNCQHLSCAKMKRVLEHAKRCQRKAGGGCRICQELVHLCCYHARRCLARECLVPFCRYIKVKLRQQQTHRGRARNHRQVLQAPPQMPNQAMKPSIAG
ncbi:CREB-binding protein-like [Orbicella faveolata]|uniref:CREB-binding protein-like n=1 Tax=Orbicella faveolata TaxID=48498 RepID=UPI0009E35A49|nr:CREB-binding protein-like [Orbicella faveolata]